MSRIAVVGAGWAGLAAAVRACERGHEVSLFEMASRPGGRARTVALTQGEFDNGQHILIGAYTETLALMHTVGADPAALLQRMPLAFEYPEGRVLRSPGGPAPLAFARAVLAAPRWSWGERLALLRTAARWWQKGFRAEPQATVAQIAAALPERVRADLIEPLCVAALNTPADRASATVFLRVLKDAVFGAPGGSDLLLPKAPLGRLFPEPAWHWLLQRGVSQRLGRRVQAISPRDGAWKLDGEDFDGVVLACSAAEAARLAAPFAPGWAAIAGAFEYEPIITVYLRAGRAVKIASPMLALHASRAAPAQFAFDLGALHGRDRSFAFVISGARDWVEAGAAATAEAVCRQARSALGLGGSETLEVIHQAAERRATFLCSPGLRRPFAQIAPGCVAAGDYVDGPYPATLEGAVRSGAAAAALF